METSNVLKPTAKPNQTLGGKFRHFVWSLLLAEGVLNGGVFFFFERLNEKGILGMGDEFSAKDLYWGDGIGMNIFRLVIFLVFAGVFGLLYGYFSKGAVGRSERIIVNTINSMLVVYYTPFVSSSNFGQILYTLAASPFYLIFLILNLVGMFVAGFYFIKVGSKIISDPYYTMDKDKNGTLLDIKWYHYLWLWLPILVYEQAFLGLIYNIGYTLITLIKTFHWYDFLGFAAGPNSLEVAADRLLRIFFLALIAGCLLAYLRHVLAGESKMHIALKILVSVAIGVVIPILLIRYGGLFS
jgi:hypothetical protein